MSDNLTVVDQQMLDRLEISRKTFLRLTQIREDMATLEAKPTAHTVSTYHEIKTAIEENKATVEEMWEKAK